MHTDPRKTRLRTTFSGGVAAALLAGSALVGAPAMATPTRAEMATATPQRLMCPYKALGDGTWVKRYPYGPRIEWWNGGEVRYIASPPDIRKGHIEVGTNKWVRKGTIARTSAGCM